MFVIPAIDIKDGQCVRLFQGEFDQVTTYGDDPIKIAQMFAQDEFRLLNVIDLDGAKNGAPSNKQLILKIVEAVTVSVPVQVGGGIRSYADAKGYLDAGVRRIILGTAAIEDPTLVSRLINDFGSDSLVIAADIKNGEFATDGWTKSGGKSIKASVKLLKNLGIKYVLVTDVSKDGSLTGPNFDLVQQFINAGFQTIGAGGIASLSDIVELNKRGAYAAVVGKAAYEKSVDIAEAQKAVAYRSGLARRIIPCLDVKDGKVVKGTHFTDLRTVGDPVAIARQYDQSGADELVFLDITATAEERKTFSGLVERIAQTTTIPFTVGGGIASLQDIKELLQAGADKVSIGSAAVLQPKFVEQAVDYFGSQCIVISIDAKKRGKDWQLYIKGGTEPTGADAVDFCKKMEELGVGELLVNSLDRDGTNMGFDVELLQAITNRVNIPVIASSGGGSLQDYLDVFEKTAVDAALGASIFHYQGVTPTELKIFLANNNVGVRL